MTVVTNNEDVMRDLPRSRVSLLVAKDAPEVLHLARDLIHMGARLINHPMAGTLTLSASPFKTLVLEPAAQPAPDLASLDAVEKSREWLERLWAKGSIWDERDVADFRMLDYESAARVLENLGVSLTRRCRAHGGAESCKL